MTDVVEEIRVLLSVPLVALAVLVGEGAAAWDHGLATGERGPEVDAMGVSLALSTGVWATRRVMSGDMRASDLLDVHAAIADANAWASAHPAELAAYDQAFAAFRDETRGER